MSISPELLEILACPACDSRPPLERVEGKDDLRCTECERTYPVNDGIPCLLVDAADENGDDDA